MLTRKSVGTLIVFLFLIASFPAVGNDRIPAIHHPNASTNATTPEQRAQELRDRLEAIRATNLKELSRKEKRAMRKEVRMIEQELAQISGGVYLSVGAVILIVLLILLLA